MVFKNICIRVLLTKVASALDGLSAEEENLSDISGGSQLNFPNRSSVS